MSLTAEHPAHPDYLYSPEAMNERVFFSQLNENSDEKLKEWNKLRAKSYDKMVNSDKENRATTNVIPQLHENPIPSKPIHSNKVFNNINNTPHLKEQMLKLVHKPDRKLPSGGRKRTRVFRKKTNKRFISKTSRRMSKSSRRTSRKYK